MKTHYYFLLTLTIVCWSGLTFSQKSQDVNLDELSSYFEKALTDWDVPGMAIGIVKNNELVLAKGYGLRQIGLPAKVDENTMFPIASNTKAFTATAIAMLVADGKLNFDDKVRKYLPYFELYDPYVSDNMTIRDLLSHRSGLKTFSGAGTLNHLGLNLFSGIANFPLLSFYT